MKSISFTENETTKMLGKSNIIFPESQESRAIAEVLQAYGIDKMDIAILSKSDIISLCNNIFILGRIYKKGKNGRKKTI